MVVHCVWRNSKFKLGEFRQVSKDIELAAVPFVGCAIEYQDDWALGTVEYVYILKDSIEVGGSTWFNDEELAGLKYAGWRIGR